MRPYLAFSLALALAAVQAFHAAPSASAASHPGQIAACIFNQQVLKTGPNACRPHALSYPRNVKGVVKRSIYDGALTFGVPYATLLVIAKCESGLNVHAANSGHLGLFQFDPDTFARGAKAMKRLTGVLAKSVWNSRDSAYVAGFLFATKRATDWTCLSQVHSVKTTSG